ncbi:MAG TPA: dihydrofolate reductase family protein [Gemmatimonadaceae bacterium]|jgi:dihydrofolate reductase
MRRLVVFNSVTLDGYFAGKDGDLSWAHKDDPEWNAFVADNARGSGPLLFGRVTYEMMVSFWPTPAAMKSFPEVAKGMNGAQKIVFSRTLDNASWNNTKLVKGDLAAEVRKMKKESGEPMTILGSGSIVSQLTQEGLIDEYQFVLNPIVLGEGRTMFDGIKNNVALKRTATRTFGNGNVVLTYEATTGA